MKIRIEEEIISCDRNNALSYCLAREEILSFVASGLGWKQCFARWNYERREHDVGYMFSDCLHSFQITQVSIYWLCPHFLSKTIILTCFSCPVYLEDVSVNLLWDPWCSLFCNSLNTAVSNLLNPIRCWMYKTFTFTPRNEGGVL